MEKPSVKQIITTRRHNTWPSWHLVFEWEDALAATLGAPLRDEPAWVNGRLARHLPMGSKLFSPKAFSPVFVMNANDMLSPSYRCNPGAVPCIVDFYLTEDKLPAFYRACHGNKLVLISSREAFDFLKAHSCPLPIAHWPLSISDKYAITPDTRFEKKYDLVLFGRQNRVLASYLKRYAEERPGFVYVDRKLENGVFTYVTNTGEVLGSDFDSRERYMGLMRQARACLYSTPGTDEGADGPSRGFSQVTPRFLEGIACGCHMISRYNNNSDTDFFELPSLSPNIETYEQFAEALDRARTTTPDMAAYAAWLSRHYTSERARQLQSLIEAIN